MIPDALAVSCGVEGEDQPAAGRELVDKQFEKTPAVAWDRAVAGLLDHSRQYAINAINALNATGSRGAGT